MSDIKNIQDGLNQHIKKVEDALEKLVTRVLLKMQADIIKILRDKQKVGYSKQLIANIRYEVTRQVGMILGVVGVGENVPYGIFVHENTKPHFPPLEPLEKWVRYKNLANQNGKGVSLKSSSIDAKIKSIAFAIALKIYRKGTTGLPFLKMALSQNLSFIESEIAKIQIA